MPYADASNVQRHKWNLWREMNDGFVDQEVCRHCGLAIFALQESRWSDQSENRILGEWKI